MFMKSILLLSFLLIGMLCLEGPSAPLWPETFSQDFVQGDSKAKIYQTGKLWYDSKNNRQRVDFSSSNFNILCEFFGRDINTSCSSIFVNKTMYVSLPQKGKCCKCCTEANGCSMLQRDWLKDYTYSGEATLSGQTFYKWSQYRESYYATEDEERVPRRLDNDEFALDLIMNTYSKNKIEDSVFQLASNCNTPCPQ